MITSPPSVGSPFADARASDPVALGWMVGTPPPPEKVIRFDDGSFFRFPQTRWSFSNLPQLMPTKRVARGSRPIALLPPASRSDIDDVTFTPMGGSEPMTWAQSLLANYTDGILILHRGRIVYERYFGVLAPDRPHIAFSLTKSLVGTLAASLIMEGALDERTTVAHYVPQLMGSGFADATIRQLLDMTTGIDYSEIYTAAASPFWGFCHAIGFLPRPSDARGPDSCHGYLQATKKSHPHGERLAYKTPNTDALAWVLSRVSGKSIGELFQERFWSQLGVEQDAFFTVDSTGTEFAGAGLSVTLRDLARFGEMMRGGGSYHGQQVVPQAVIEDIRRGGNRVLFDGAGYKTLPGATYRAMWLVLHNAHGAYMARGLHGQGLYIDPTAEMVIARFASHPLASNAHLDPTSLPAYQAVAEFLMNHPR